VKPRLFAPVALLCVASSSQAAPVVYSFTSRVGSFILDLPDPITTRTTFVAGCP